MAVAPIASQSAWLKTAAGQKYGPAGYSTYVSNMQKYNAAQSGGGSSSSSSSASKPASSSSSSSSSSSGGYTSSKGKVATYEQWLNSAPGRTDRAGYQRYLTNMGAVATGGGGGGSSSPKGTVASYQQWLNSAPGRVDQAGYQRYLSNMGVTGGSTGLMGSAGAMNFGGPVRTANIRWKPVSEKDGRLVVLSNANAPTQIIDAHGNVIATGRNDGPSNGYLSTVRFDRPGDAFQGAYLKIGNDVFSIPNAGANYRQLQTVGGGGQQQGFGTQVASNTVGAGGGGAGQGQIMKVDPYDSVSVNNFLQANPQLKGAMLGGTYHQNPFYDPNATGAMDAGIFRNGGRGGNTASQLPNNAGLMTSGDGPFYYRAGTAKADLHAQMTAPAQAAPMSYPAPSGGGGGGGGGGITQAANFDVGSDVEPYTREVRKPDWQTRDETVQGQLTNLLDQGNPYIERARFFGRETAAARGLLNSTLASQASQAAAIDAGLPIASQDAQTFFAQANMNQNAINRFREQELLQGYRLQEQSLANDYAQQQIRLQSELGLQNTLSTLSAQQSNALQLSYLGAQQDVWGNPYLSPQQQALGSQRLSSLYGYGSAYSSSYLG